MHPYKEPWLVVLHGPGPPRLAQCPPLAKQTSSSIASGFQLLMPGSLAKGSGLKGTRKAGSLTLCDVLPM